MRKIAARCLVLSLFFAVPSSYLHADSNTSAANFESCVGINLANEKKKNTPDVEAIITVCQEEYDVLIAGLPTGIREQVVHDLKEKIKQILR